MRPRTILNDRDQGQGICFGNMLSGSNLTALGPIVVVAILKSDTITHGKRAVLP